MLIAFAAENADWNCELESRFGRINGFVVLNTDSNTLSRNDNVRNSNLEHGAGIQTAQALVNAGVSAVITVNLGPKAFDILKEATIPVYYANQGVTIRMASELYKNKGLELAETPTR